MSANSDKMQELIAKTVATSVQCRGADRHTFSVEVFFTEESDANDFLEAIIAIRNEGNDPTSLELSEDDLETNKDNLIEDCIHYLDAVCDGARAEDTVGFSGAHTAIGKRAAARLRAGKLLSSEEIAWAKHNLPYYFNTQLQFVPRKFFHELCNRKYEEALDREAREKEELETFMRNMRDEKASYLLKFIDIGNVEPGDLNFLTSLQNWRGNHTSRQMPHVRKFVEKYFNREWLKEETSHAT